MSNVSTKKQDSQKLSNDELRAQLEEKSLILPKKTVRQAVVKLELSGTTDHQLDKVAHNLYGLDDQAHLPAKNNQLWSKVDRELYAVAKDSYDGMLAPFLQKPKVYKFMSTRQKIWDDFIIQEAKRKEEEALRELEKQTGGTTKRRATRIRPAKPVAKDSTAVQKPIKKKEEEDDALTTYLDPFEVAPPWRKDVSKDGTVTYFNSQTQKRQNHKPTEEVWASKVEMLEKLTPRDDLDGYEYKENLAEKRKRQRIFTDFDAKLQVEIDRRENNPSELEQVEDVLYYLVDTISTIEEMRVKDEKKKARQILTKSWHTATKNRRFRELGKVETEEGEIVRVVTDLDFADMLISETGAVLPLVTPPGLFEGHERERVEKKRIEDEKQALIELDRQRPLKEKAKEILDLARSGDHAAAKQRVKDEIDWRVAKLPSQVKQLNQFVLEKSKIAVVHGVRGILKASKDPTGTATVVRDTVLSFCHELIKGPPTEEELHLAMLLDQVKAEEDAEKQKTASAVESEIVPVETEEEKRLKEYRSKQPKPITFIDTAQITLTLLVDPPPLYEMRPPKTDNEELTHAILQKVDALSRNLNRIGKLRKAALSMANSVISKSKGSDQNSSSFALDPKDDKKIVGESSNQLTSSQELKSVDEAALEKLAGWIQNRRPIDLLAGVAGRRYVTEKEYEDILQREQEWKERLKPVKQKPVPPSVPMNDNNATTANVPVRSPTKIPMNSRDFLANGFVAPVEENKPRASWGFPKPIAASASAEVDVADVKKLVMDDSVRSAFENRFLGEISAAACIPVKNFQLEEIRRLEPNDPRLLELKQRRKAIVDEQRRLDEIAKMNLEFDKERRKALADGNFDERNWQGRLMAASKLIGAGGTFTSATAQELLTASAMLDLVPTLEEEGRQLPPPHPHVIGKTHLEAINETESVVSELDGVPGSSRGDFKEKTPTENVVDSNNAVVPNTRTETSSALKQTRFEVALPLNSEEKAHHREEQVPSKVSDLIIPTEPKERSGFESIFEFANNVISPSSPVSGSVSVAESLSSAPAAQIQQSRPTIAFLLDASVASSSIEETEPSLELKQKSKPIVEPKQQEPIKEAEDASCYSRASQIPNTQSAPQRPPYFKSGIANPDDLKYDPKYWLSKELRELNTDEKRQRRIAKLKMSVKETGLNLRLQQLRELKSQLLFDASMYVDPVVDVLKPITEKAKEKIKQSNLFERFSSLTKGRILQNSTVAPQPFEIKAAEESKLTLPQNVHRLTFGRYHPEVLSTMNDLLDEVERRHGWSETITAIPLEVMVLMEEMVDRVVSMNHGMDSDLAVDRSDSNRSQSTIKSSPRVQEIETEELHIAQDLDKLHVRQLYFQLTEGDAREDLIEGDLDNEKYSDHHSDDDSDETNSRKIVASMLEKMCLAVVMSSNNNDTSVNVAAKEKTDPGSQLLSNGTNFVEYDDRVWGCEITLTVFVDDQQRQLDGLEDIEAEDIAIMLREQVNSVTGTLAQGELSRHILDVRYKLPHKKRSFKRWENFWVHIIHPVFFGYQAARHIKKKRDGELEQTASGIRWVKPSSAFSERSKYTYQTLMAKEKKFPPKDASNNARNNSVLSLASDAVSVVSGSKLAMFRPKMSELTKADVERCRRVHRAFELRYDEAMNRGLVDGKRLRPEQYAAMKDRDTAYRIFRTARQKLNAIQRALKEDNTPKIQLTEITTEVFDGWVREIKEEESLKLKEQRLKAAREKNLRQQENELKGNYSSLRTWLISQLIQHSVSPIDIAQALDVELSIAEDEQVEVKTSEVQNSRLVMLTEKYHELKMQTIAEQKRTRKLFGCVLQWLNRSAQPLDCGPAPALADVQRQSTRMTNTTTEESEANVHAVSKQELMEFLSCYFTAMPNIVDSGSSRKLPPVNEPKLREALERGSSGHFSMASGLSARSSIELSVIGLKRELNADDIAACQATNWIEVARRRPELIEIISEMPTIQEGKFARDELIQFSSLMVELEPMYSRVVSKYLKQKEDAKLKSKSKQSRKESRKLHAVEAALKKQNDIAEAAKEAEELKLKQLDEAANAEKAAVEAKRKQEAYLQTAEGHRRQMRIQEGRLQAHQHRFISIPGENPFCVVCLEKRFDHWLENYMSEEKSWKTTFEEELTEDLLSAESVIEQNIQTEFRAYLQVFATRTGYLDQRLAKVKKEVKLRRKPLDYEIQFNTKKIDDLCEDEYFALISEVIRVDSKFLSTGFSDAMVESGQCSLPPRLSNEIILPRAKTMALPFLLSGLAVYDPRGVPLQPEPEPEPEEEEKAPIGSMKPGSSKKLGDEEEEDDNGNPPLGLRIRLWHYDSELLVRGAFLGEMKLKFDDIMNPPKGTRTYDLENNLLCFQLGGFETEPQGTLTIKVTGMNRDKETKDPTAWRIEILKATGLLPVTSLLSCNALCEIFWRGPAEKNDNLFLFKKWIKVGETRVIYNNLSPSFSKKENNTYDLPPVWTDMEIEGRGVNGSLLVGGGWVSKNNIPDPERIKFLKAELEKTKSSRNNKKELVSILTGNQRLEHDIEATITETTAARVEMTRLLWKAEELERNCMAKEEIAMRKCLLQAELLRCKPYADLQVEYGRQFTKLLHYSQGIPPGLARQRFLMAKGLDCGGLRAECQDPTTNMISYVYMIPILYPEDEVELTTHLGSIIGSQHPNIVKILDFSAHNVRSFTHTGFPAFNDRLVVARVEKVEDGIPVLNYINAHWSQLTDLMLKNIFKQILSGFQFLHEFGIFHRNVSPDCVLIQEIHQRRRGNNGGNPSSTENRGDQRPLERVCCRIGDYWFLDNPRKSGCQYSTGRADWGTKVCQPPEIARGSVDEKSDIYAFGMCAFYWACGGINTLQYKPSISIHEIENLKSQIPLKWGDWLHAMLRQCLQPHQRSRPTAKELIAFLNTQYFE